MYLVARISPQKIRREPASYPVDKCAHAAHGRKRSPIRVKGPLFIPRRPATELEGDPARGDALSRPRPLIYPESVERHMGISEFLEGQNLTHRQMGAIMVGWILLVAIVSVGLLLYTAAT